MDKTEEVGTKYFRVKAPAPINKDEWFLVDLKTAEVLFEEPRPDLPEFITENMKKNGVAKLFESRDQVNHPAHYNQGKIEVIEFIEDQRLSYHLGNTVKYVARAGKKIPEKCTNEMALDLEIQDLKKAAWYLNRRIEVLKAQREGRDLIRPNDMVRANQ